MTNEELLRSYAKDCTERTMRTDFYALGEIVDILIKAKRNGQVIYTAGNGGSLATASHMCNDLSKGCRVHNRVGFNAICLGDSAAVTTCLSNDFCYYPSVCGEEIKKRHSQHDCGGCAFILYSTINVVYKSIIVI